MISNPKIGDKVYFADPSGDRWRTTPGTVVSAGDGTVAVFVGLDRDQILDGVACMRFVPLECVWPTRAEADAWAKVHSIHQFEH